MPEPKAGPIFKIGTHYLRTRVEADGVHVVNPVDMRAVWPKPGEGPKLNDPEVMKFMAWMRSGKPPAVPAIDIRKIPFAIVDRAVVSPAVALVSEPESSAYCRLFDVLAHFKFSEEEAREHVNSGALRLSAERADWPLERMLVSVRDLQDFAKTTGFVPPSGPMH